MVMLLSKGQVYHTADKNTPGIAASLQKYFCNWLAYKNRMHTHWEKFREQEAAGHHVPYRVWLRHSAYLELNCETGDYGALENDLD